MLHGRGLTVFCPCFRSRPEVFSVRFALERRRKKSFYIDPDQGPYLWICYYLFRERPWRRDGYWIGSTGPVCAVWTNVTQDETVLLSSTEDGRRYGNPGLCHVLCYAGSASLPADWLTWFEPDRLFGCIPLPSHACPRSICAGFPGRATRRRKRCRQTVRIFPRRWP